MRIRPLKKPPKIKPDTSIYVKIDKNLIKWLKALGITVFGMAIVIGGKLLAMFTSLEILKYFAYLIGFLLAWTLVYIVIAESDKDASKDQELK